MPKYRQLHTKIIDSFDFNEMPDDFTRVTWMLLTLILDSEGRGIDNMAWIKSRMYPLRDDKPGDQTITDQISRAFDWFADPDREMIIRYEVGGRHYFYVPTFKDYQKGTEYEAKSLLPPPPLVLSDNLELTSKLPVGSLEVAPPQLIAAESASASASASELESESASAPRPNIFRIYETEIGPLTPMIADELKAAELDYPPEWLSMAIKESASHNKRNWKYCLAILKRWKAEGLGSNGNGKNGKPHSNGKQSAAEILADRRLRMEQRGEL